MSSDVILSPLEFLKNHFEGCNPEHFLEIRPIGPQGPKGITFIQLGQLEDSWKKIEPFLHEINQKQGANIYFGVATRTREAGTDDAVGEWPCLMVDVDHLDKAMIRKNFAVIQGYNLSPNIRLQSGGGYHAYWYLKEPASHAEIEPVLKNLIRVLGADRVCHDGPRIMRVPGFLNVKAKYGPKFPRCAVLPPYDYSRRFIPMDFDPLLTAKDGELPAGAAKPVYTPKLTCEVYGNGHGFAYTIANLAAPHWKEGIRHGLALGVSAWLRQADVPEADATVIIEKIASTAGDTQEMADRLTAVKTTYAAPMERVSSSSLLIEVLGKDTAINLMSDFRRAHNAIPPAPVRRKKLPAFEMYDYIQPGSWLDRYVCYASEVIDAPMQFHFVCGMAALAAAMGNKVKVKIETWRPFNPHIFAMLIAPPAWYRKTECINVSARMIKAAGIKIFTSNITVEQMYAECCPTPCEYVDKRNNAPCGPPLTPDDAKNVKTIGWRGSPSGAWLFGEFTRTLENSNKSYMGDFKPLLLELFDSNDVAEMNSRKTKTSGNYYIEDPAISFVGGITPYGTKANLTITDALGGLTSRMLPIWYDPDFNSNDEWKDVDPNHELDAASLSNDLLKVAQSPLQGIMTLTKEARVEWVKLKKEVKAYSRNLDGPDAAMINGSLGRLLTYCGKVAAILARSSDPDMMMIDAPTLKLAANFTRYLMGTLEFIYEEIRPEDGNTINKNLDKLMGSIRRLAKKTGRDRFTARDVRLASHLNGRDFDDAVKAASDSGRVIYTGKDGDHRRSLVLNEKD